MEVCRKDDSIIIKEKEIIEEYNLNSEINFQKLIKYLLNFNLSENVVFENKIDDLNDSEENLIKITKKIIDDYNEKVDEFNKFKEDNK